MKNVSLSTIACVLALLPMSHTASAQAPHSATPALLEPWPQVAARHPAHEALQRLFPATPAVPAAPRGFAPTGLGRKDYLALIAGNVDFFKGHQNEAGAIIDPFEKRERQYATPAFALCSALLIARAGRDDLLDPATRAMTFALTALQKNTTADAHADFYIPMLMHARRLLQNRVPQERFDAWTAQLQSLVPEKAYRDVRGGGNWNLVNVAGECLRRKDGLVAPEQREAQSAYIERSVAGQKKNFAANGMYEDPNAPLAYDVFPRLWLEDVVADGAHQDAELEDLLVRGGLSTLLLLSPSGEWATGGRSALHAWNEAAVAVVCEVNAARWKSRRPDIAGAFKRAARLSLGSLQRWQRPSGELWIVKNRAEPSQRHGYEGYSFHSQYNLLPAAMLAIAHERADESIAERPSPAEVGGFVFDVRERFHKIRAAAAGLSILIDTGADPHYNASGLQSLHRAGVPFSPLSDSTAADRSYGPSNARDKAALSPGAQWREAEGEPLRSVAGFDNPLHDKAPGAAVVRGVELTVREQTPARVAFSLRWNLEGPGARPVEEEWTVSARGVEVTTRLGGEAAPAATRFALPALVSDGATDTTVTPTGARLEIKHAKSVLRCEVLAPAAGAFRLEGPRVASRQGWVQVAAADLPAGTREVKWRLSLDAE